MSNPKWQVGPVKLVNNEDAFIDAINEGQEDYRYIGRIRNFQGEWIAAGWHANGRYMYAHTDHGLNLAPPPKKTMLTNAAWMVVRKNGDFDVFYSHKTAREVFQGVGAFAIRKIEPFEVTEGEGL
jgi:hypothetical protein